MAVGVKSGGSGGSAGSDDETGAKVVTFGNVAVVPFTKNNTLTRLYIADAEYTDISTACTYVDFNENDNINFRHTTSGNCRAYVSDVIDLSQYNYLLVSGDIESKRTTRQSSDYFYFVLGYTTSSSFYMTKKIFATNDYQNQNGAIDISSISSAQMLICTPHITWESDYIHRISGIWLLKNKPSNDITIT